MVVARLTGLEPETPGVTGRYSNQLIYNRSQSANAAASALAGYLTHYMWSNLIQRRAVS